MKNRTRILLIALLVITSMIFSSVLTLFVQFSVGARSVVPEEEIARLREIEARYQKVEQLKSFIDSNYYLPTKDVDFQEGLIDGLFSALDDPYSVYFNKDEFKSFNESSAGSFGGIGIVIEPGKDNLITVVSPIEDTPGERAGIQTGDKILKVDGIEVFADKTEAAIKRMKGKPGTEVTLTIYRADQEPFDLKITRAMIVIKAVKSRILTEAGNLGYLRITSFDEKVFEEFKTHYQELKAKGATGLIIDLRNNPGGSLQQCVELSDYILGEQLIVYTKDNSGKEERFNSDKAKIDLPIAVLVNKGSASASEILTGAIKDGKAGTIIGTTTFGKGLVQTVRDLKDGDGIKLTIAQYFTPSGAYIHGVGIEPNIVVEQPEKVDPADDKTDLQLQKAIEVLLKGN